MIVADLLLSERPATFRPPEVDPLVDRDALREAQVLGVRVDVVSGIAGVLFEFRVAMHMIETNTGVLVATGVEDFRWAAESRSTALTAWNVLASSVEQESAGFRLKLSCFPDADLSLRAASLTFFNCQVLAIAEVPPDYTSGEESVRSSLAGWHSEIDVVSGSSLWRA